MGLRRVATVRLRTCHQLTLVRLAGTLAQALLHVSARGDALRHGPTMRVNASSRRMSKPLLNLFFSRVGFYKGPVVKARSASVRLSGSCGVATCHLARTRLAYVVLGHPAVSIWLVLLLRLE